MNQYPWLKPQPVRESVAERELKKAQATRSCLESNLEAVLTSRHGGADVYAVLDALYRDGYTEIHVLYKSLCLIRICTGSCVMLTVTPRNVR